MEKASGTFQAHQANGQTFALCEATGGFDDTREHEATDVNGASDESDASIKNDASIENDAISDDDPLASSSPPAMNLAVMSLLLFLVACQ